MLFKATGSPTVCCNGQGSGLLLHRRHRHRVYCPRRWLSPRPAAPLHLGPPHGMALCRFMYPTSAVTQTLSSPLIGVLHAWLGMSGENKHAMKDGKTTDISQRNTMTKVFPVNSFQQFASSHHRQTDAHTSLSVSSSQRAVPFLVRNISESFLGSMAQTKQQEQTPYWFAGVIQNKVMQHLAPSSSSLQLIILLI